MITGRKVFVQSIFALCICAAALVFVFPLRTYLREQIGVYVDHLHQTAESTITTYIDYESISPKFFNKVEIHDISLSKIEGIPGADVTADSATVSYPFFALLFRENIPLIDIEFSNLTLSADLVEDWEWFELIYRLIFEMPEFDVDLAQVSADNLELSLDYSDYHISSSIAPFQMSYHFKDHVLTSNFGDSEHDISGQVKASAATEGQTSLFYSEERTTLQTPSLSGEVLGYGSFDSFPLYVAFAEDTLYSSFRSTNTNLLLNYSLISQKFQLTASSDQFTLDNEIEITYQSDMIDAVRDIEDLDVSLDIKGRLHEDFSVSDISYEGEFRLPSYEIGQFSLSYLQSRFSGNNEKVVFDTLQGRVQDIPFRYKGNVQIAELSPTGTLDIRPPEELTQETLSFSLTAAGNKKAEIDFVHDDFSISSVIDYQDISELYFSTDLMTGGRSYHIPFSFDPEQRYLAADESSDVHFTVDFKHDHINMLAQWDKLYAPVQDSVFEDIPFSGSIFGSIRGKDDYRFSIHELYAHDIPVGNGSSADIKLQANVTPNFLNILSISYMDAYGEITGKGSAQFDLEERIIQRASVQASEYSEKYQLSFTNYEGFYDGELTVSSGNIERYPFIDGSGTIDGSVSFFGVSQDLTFEFDAHVPELAYRGNYYTASISGTADSQGITITDSSISFENIVIDEIHAGYDFLNGEFDVTSEIDFQTGDSSISASIYADSKLPEISSYRELANFTDYIEDTVIQVRMQDFMIGEMFVSEEMVFDLSFCQDTLTLEGGEQDRHFSLLVDHSRREYQAALSGDLPLQFDAYGKWGEEGLFNLYAEDLVLDMTFLNYTEIPELEFKSGIAEGYLMITGNIQDPDFYGELTADELTATLGYIPETLSVNNVAMTVHGKEMNFAKANIMVGDVPVRSKLDFYIENWIPQYFDMKFSVDEGTYIPSSYVFPAPQVTYDGMISGVLNLEIYPTGTTITGDLILDEAVVSLITETYDPPDDPLPVTGDLRITTGRSTQFILPTRELPILTANAEANQTVRITFDNLKRTFSIDGNIGLKSGEIFYVRRNFYITEGRIQLAETERQIDPQVSLRARIREYDREAERVDIFLVAENQRLSNLNPRFESNPPMSINEIAQILGEGFQPSDHQVRGGVSPTIAFATVATDILYQFGLIEQLNLTGNFERNIRNALGVDVFSIRTQVVQNAILGNLQDTGITNPIATTLDNTTVFLGKYFGDSMFFQTMLVLSESRDQDSGLFFTDDLEMDLELSFEWETPLYDLTISTQPELNIPGLFSDFSIGISWRYSF